MRTKEVFAFVLFFGLVSSGSHASSLDLGSPTSRTPYDPYLAPMWKVLHGSGGRHPSLGRVEELLIRASAFRYSYNADKPYVPQSPSVTEASGSGDCKAKCLWLAAKMQSSNVRYVIGKSRLGDRNNHAWLIWRGPTGWVILDPVNYPYPLSPRELSPQDYVPLYSYGVSGRFAHTMSAGARDTRMVSSRQPQGNRKLRGSPALSRPGRTFARTWSIR